MNKRKHKTTKQLAIELGLVRKRTAASLASKTHNYKRTGQIFYYLVVIDFESTCWEDRRNIPQEIIEFPAVLLNTSTGQIECEFHHYVQPQEKPILSGFCKQLTGITQEQVDDGIPINLCLSRFSHWLQKLVQEKNISYNTAGPTGSRKCTFVTWSDWDLGVCLEFESRRKQLRKPAPLCSWIDLRATYRKFYSRKPSGLNGALLDLGIAFEGRQHSGLDDARNTAKLAWKMICDGCLMSITKTLSPSWRGQGCIGRSLPQPTLVTSTTAAADHSTGRRTRQIDSVVSLAKYSDKKPDSEHAAAKPAVLVVRPDIGHAAAKPAVLVVRPDNGHAAAKPAVLVVRPDSEHAAAKLAVLVVRPDIGHAAAKPAVLVVRPDIGHAAAKPAVLVVRPDNGHAAAKPAVSVARPDSGHAAAKPALSVVRPDSGHAAAKPALSVVKPDNGHAAAKPALSVVRPNNGHAVAKPALSVGRPGSGHAAAKPAVPVVRPGSGHAAAKPAVSVVRPDSGHVAAKPAVSVVRPDSGHVAAKPTVSVIRPGSGHAAAKPLVRSDSRHAAAKPTVSVVRPDSGHTKFMSLKPSCAKTFTNDQTKSRPAVSTNICLARSSATIPKTVIAPGNMMINPQGRKRTGFQVYSPPTEQRKSSFGVTLTTIAPRDITNLPVGMITTSPTETRGSVTLKGLHAFTKTSPAIDSPVLRSYYVASTPSPNDCNIKSCNFKTPSITPQTGGACMLKTPPLCRCGRRCKRNYVQSPGANVGRSFFSCPLGRRSAGSENSSAGCGYFQWELPVTKRRHTSSPASFSSGSVTKSIRFSPSSGLIPQPNFDTPGSEVRRVGQYSINGQCLR